MTAPTFVLGQRVRITGTVVKVRKWSPPRTEYVAEPMWASKTDMGIIIGKRTVADYRIDLGGYEELTTATAVHGSHRPVWLIALHMSRKPVMVYAEQIEPIPSDAEVLAQRVRAELDRADDDDLLYGVGRLSKLASAVRSVVDGW